MAHNAAMPSIMPMEVPSGVVGTFLIATTPLSESTWTRSVKVPPTSIPIIRIAGLRPIW
jgi:hypothetical protein